MTDSSPVPWMLERIIDVAFDIPVLAVAAAASLPPAVVAIAAPWSLFKQYHRHNKNLPLAHVSVWRFAKNALYANAICSDIM